MSFLFGASAYANLDKLSKKLEDQALLKSSIKLSASFHRYSLWMSNYDNKRRFFVAQSVFDKLSSGDLVPRNKDLEVLHSALLDENGGFKYLDPEDTIRTLHPLPDLKYRIFSEVTASAIDTISHVHPSLSRLFDRLIGAVIPVTPINGDWRDLREYGTGLSTHALRGALFMSLPYSSPILFEHTLNLVHELGHQVLMTYQCCDPLFPSGCEYIESFSVIRRTTRPAAKSLHALVATAFMVELLNHVNPDHLRSLGVSKSYFERRYQGLIGDLGEGIDILAPIPKTPLGSLIFDELTDRLTYSRLTQKRNA